MVLPAVESAREGFPLGESPHASWRGPDWTRQRPLRLVALTLPHSSFSTCLKEKNLRVEAFETSKDEISRGA